nr:ubiquitin carboxyl-terminal hydrolase 47-like [Pelodiscus sinensis]|eukprot:XP_006113276.2 ubiquitin carboxyl-terminal hydrolase 47-like [Pelodiscus sinensis]
MHGDRYLSDRESCGNDRCYHSADTQGQEMQEEQLSQDVQNSAAASRLLYYRVNPDTRPSGYVGLRNQGSTCYLNSLLQCLFFTPELRDAILRPDPVDGSSIVCPLKTLFEQMKWGSSAPSTEGITRCLGVSNVHQQQDVAEYFRILMNKIIEDKRDIQQATKDGSNLEVAGEMNEKMKDKALDDVQKVNYFTGDEQLYCEKCQRKQDATSHYDFETLPPILVLNLKRYWFGEAGFRKLHCNVSVPFSLTVESKTYIIHYELFAMCHHHGGIYGGHYVAEIKSYEDNCWYEFNDTRVYKVSGDQNTMDKKNSSTAYLLMYHMAKSVRKPSK